MLRVKRHPHMWRPASVRWECSGEHLDEDKSREKAKMIEVWEDAKDSSIRSGKQNCVPETDKKCWSSYLENL